MPQGIDPAPGLAGHQMERGFFVLGRPMEVFDDPKKLPTPPLLSQIVWLNYKAGPEQGRFACIRCAVRQINSKEMKMTEAESFLDAWGALPENPTIVALLIPCKCVTYLGMGPEFTTNRGGIAENRLIVMPNCETAPRAMSIEKIRAALAEFSA